MMKKLLSILCTCFLICLLITPISADNYTYVYDEYGLLSSEERSQLNEKARSLSEQYECGIYIVITDDQHGYSESSYAQGIYMNYDLGYNEGASGVLLAIAMNERFVDATAYGAAKETTFGTYELDSLLNTAYEYLVNGDWYGALDAYIDEADRMLSASGYTYYEPEYTDPVIDNVTVQYSPAELRSSFFSVLPFGAIGAVLIGVLQAFIRKRKLKTTGIAKRAGQYKMSPTVRFTRKQDLFTGTTRKVTKIPRNNNRSGGGGGHSYHSSGFSHSSGGKHF